MARMVPFPILPTTSTAERRLYEGFLEQLGDEFVCYHSVDWVLRGTGETNDVGEADFVIAHPDLGVLALEVKGGRVRFDQGAWSQSGRSGTHRLDEDPFHQAEDEMRDLVAILSAQPGWDRWKPSYGYALALPDAEYRTDAHPRAPSTIVIDRDDLDRLDERVRQIMGEWHREGRTFGDEGMRALARALGYRIEMRAPLGFGFDRDDTTIIELTRDQAWALAYVEHRRRAAVVGPPGSGKTLLAVEIAKRRATAGRKVLLGCVTEPMADHLRSCVAGVGDLDVETVGDLGATGGRADVRYDTVVIDQAHLVEASRWPTVRALLREPDGGELYLFSDDPPSSEGAPVDGAGEIARLDRDRRTPEAIREFVAVVHDAGDKAGQKPAGQGASGQPPEILGYEGVEELERLLASVLENLIEGEGLETSEVVVLTAATGGESRVKSLERAGALRLGRIPKPDTVQVFDLREFEGLERSVVVLVEVGGDDARLAAEVGRGASRATKRLLVLAPEEAARRLRHAANRE